MVCTQCHASGTHYYYTITITITITIIIIILAHQHKTSRQKIGLSVVKAKWPQRRSFGGESAAEGDRIAPLQSHWQLLEQEACLPWIISDGCDCTAQLLR